jgi:citrate lyase subunit beta/citryl-CoA lyase
MHELDALLTHLERRLGIPVATIATPLGCETAKAMRNVYEIVTQCRRVTQVTLAAGPGGDAARAIGYTWSKEGTGTSRTSEASSATRRGTGSSATVARR